MRKINFIIAICAIVISACGDSGIKPKTAKISGPLGEFFEVVDREYKFVPYENNKDLLQINVEIKRIKEGGPKDASWSSEPTFSISIMDGSENVIATESSDIVFEKEELENIFALGIDETSSIPFKTDKDKANATVLFKISSKWDATKEKSSDDEASIDVDAAEVEQAAAEVEQAANEIAGEAEPVTAKPSLDVSLPSALKGSVEIVAAEKYMGDHDFPTVDVTFKLLKNVNTSSLCSGYGQMWIVGVGQDANGVSVRDLLPSYNEWRSGDSDGHEFKEFLEGEVGETITLSFTGDNNIELFEKDQSKIDAGKAKTEAGLEKVEKFKLTLTK